MGNRQADHRRQLLAQEAARLMVTESLDDYRRAKEKAAERLGIRDKCCMPHNDEIDQAAAEYGRLFAAGSQAKRLVKLRNEALKAMEFLEAFAPCLTGGVASGAVGEHTPIVIELFTDAPEQVIHRLQDADIPYVERDYPVTDKTGKGHRVYPKISFLANEVPLELLIFPSGMRQQKVTGKERLSLKQLRQALNEAAGA